MRLTPGTHYTPTDCSGQFLTPFSLLKVPFTLRIKVLQPSKNELARSCKNLARSCTQDLHAICPFSCTILHQFLQDLAKNVQEMQVIILAATLAKSCTISCKICARLCKNRARKGTYRVQVLHARFLQDSCTILHDLASSFLLGGADPGIKKKKKRGWGWQQNFFFKKGGQTTYSRGNLC